MLPNFSWPEPEKTFDEKLIADVKSYGCHVINVFSDAERPGWSFSIGLFLNYGHPEVVIAGLPDRTAHVIINDICERAKRGETFFAGSRTGELLKGLDVCFVDVAAHHYQDHLGYALWFYSSLSQPFPCVQLVWPDRGGRFPWEPDHDSLFKPLQPILASLV